VELLEALFDADYPGHFLRRLKGVAITISGVAGPYTTINCTLTLLSSKIRIRAASAPEYREQPPDPRFQYDPVAVQTIATSACRNDSGLFELHFGDEGYLPFEGAGAISRWRIELPKDANPFDFEMISDIVLKLGYYARQGGEVLRQEAQTSRPSRDRR
jgi:receptor-binding and translocation channel-forming TcA subunit of Tc toxin